MRARFWHERWQQNQIGFHQSDINQQLEQYWQTLQLPDTATVFVPLCGKSRDMLWLRQRGHSILGIELSEIAVRDFFTENDMEPQISQQGAFQRWEADGVALLVGDFFQLTAADLAHCMGVYDRASLIALPPDMRQTYAAHLKQILAPSSQTLLITIEYEQGQFGPPFSVTPQEVDSLYQGGFSVERLHSADISQQMPNLINKGVPSVTEHVFRLKHRV